MTRIIDDLEKAVVEIWNYVSGFLGFATVSATVELLESVSVITAAVVAIYGINAWRRELRGKKEYELAEEALTLFYRARDHIRHIRSPFGTTGEGQSRAAKENETPEQKKALDQAYAVLERYEKNRETFERLHAIRYRFMAVFEKDKAEPFEELNRIVQEIFIAATILGTYWQKGEFGGLGEEVYAKRRATIGKHEKIFWQQSENDDIAARIDKVVADMEGYCGPIIRSRDPVKKR